MDLETSDLLRKDLPLDDDRQPWILSVAAELAGPDCVVTDSVWTRIKAEGRTVKDGAAAVHGITSRRAGMGGVTDAAALGMLVGFSRQAKYLVSYGTLDRDVVTSVLMRLQKRVDMWIRPGLEHVDVIRTAAHFCKLPSEHENQGYRWPNLDEACATLLDEPRRTGPHNSRDDCSRMRRVFLWLKVRGAFEGIDP